MSAIRTASNSARDPLEAIRALDPRLPQAMQRADLPLLQAIRCDLKQRWSEDASDGDGDRP